MVPSPFLRAVAKRVAAAWHREWGGSAPAAEVRDVLLSLAVSIHRRRPDPDAPIEPRARCALGQRLLELLRAEVMRGWLETATPAGTYAEVLAIRIAIERVRQAIELDRPEDVASRLAGPDGGEILVAIAHDLRSPLTSILFLAETLQRGRSGAVNEVQRRQLALIYGAALGLSSVASDIIDLVRDGDQLVEKEPVLFSVRAVLESVRDIVRPIAEERQLAVRLVPPAGDHRLGHPVALSRVLLNLTTNALKFTDEGHVEIVTQEIGPDRVEFAVSDSGDGIDSQIVESLYQPLRPVAANGGRSFSSTGLGLTMCRKLTVAMGSELKVVTRPGRGTRFYFELSLPRCRKPGSPQRPESVSRPRRVRQVH